MELEKHYVNRSAWLRVAFLGANDGILSTASIAIGVAAASDVRNPIVLASLAGLVAGAFSMAGVCLRQYLKLKILVHLHIAKPSLITGIYWMNRIQEPVRSFLHGHFVFVAKRITIGFMFFCSSMYAQERYVDINGQKYRIKEFGKGEISIIFESGMSDSLEVWGAIPDSVSKYARVFLYDRADIGKSDTSGIERTIPNMVLELKNILENQNIKPPYLLIGHSLGGLITRYFASNYPEEVMGLLLLDPAPESYWERMSKEALEEYIKGGTEWYETNFPPQYRKEWYQFIPNLDYMINLHIDRHLPVILVSATAWDWYNYHEDILVEFDNSRHVELEGEHHIFKDHPDSIMNYIYELLNKK
ncbi:MAG: alpha/beta fold hydrolase [Bacteroidota bacterium]